MTLSTTEQDQQNARRQRAWDKQASRYDRQIGWWERHVLGRGNRAWAAQRARGDVLDVAVGTGLNLPFYDTDLKVTGIDLSPAMLDIARQRAAGVGRDVDLREGDAHHLPFENASFDTIVCTFSLCNIPDPHQAVSEMRRVLRPGGRLILVDHIRSTSRPIYWLQKAIEPISVRIDGDHMTRRPADIVQQLGFDIVERDRFRRGIVERLVALKPA
ncbi:MAG: class I SAM-dependent methyltransferase [Acidimicrobiales bacterium]